VISLASCPCHLGSADVSAAAYLDLEDNARHDRWAVKVADALHAAPEVWTVGIEGVAPLGGGRLRIYASALVDGRPCSLVGVIVREVGADDGRTLGLCS